MKTLFHIPHSSISIPKEYRDDFLLSNEELENECKLMSDIRTAEMVDDDSIVFQYSRIFCDVERFNSDKEIMNSIGMGIIYTNTHDLKPLRRKVSKEIIDFYLEHHKKLNDVTKDYLEKYKEIKFIDLHSYSKEPMLYELYKHLERPDICIGVNERYNKTLLEKIIYTIKKFGYSFKINEPFKGCLLPSEYIDDERVNGFMIEINKDCYKTETEFLKIKELLKCVEKI